MKTFQQPTRGDFGGQIWDLVGDLSVYGGHAVDGGAPQRFGGIKEGGGCWVSEFAAHLVYGGCWVSDFAGGVVGCEGGHVRVPSC